MSKVLPECEVFEADPDITSYAILKFPLKGILRKIMGGGTGTGTDSESGSRPMSPSFSYGNNHHQRNVSDLSSNIYANQVSLNNFQFGFYFQPYNCLISH